MTSTTVARYEHVERDVGDTLWVDITYGELTLSFLPHELHALALYLKNRSGISLPATPGQVQNLGRIRLEPWVCNEVLRAKLTCGNVMAFVIDVATLDELVNYWFGRYAPTETIARLQDAAE